MMSKGWDHIEMTNHDHAALAPLRNEYRMCGRPFGRSKLAFLMWVYFGCYTTGS
jgi:hypothetical protein